MKYKDKIKRCFNNIKDSIIKTPLQHNLRLSNKYKTNIYLKREDQQNVRSFKIRGALNKINTLTESQIKNGLVCASAGNHAQGFAYTCNKLKIIGDIFVPNNTPLQKINRIKYFGGNNIDIHIDGDTFNQTLNKSLEYSSNNNKSFIHPFDDKDVIDGQATIGYEIDIQSQDNGFKPDVILTSVGGGGLIAGLSQYFSDNNIVNEPYIYGVEPKGAASLYESLKQKKRVLLDNIDNFVDGASVSQIGELTYDICRQNSNINIKDVYTVTNDFISHELINCYQDDGIILEPAGVLPICGLTELSNNINLVNKNIVCVVSGGNNDITRYGEIMELNLQYLGLKHYFLVKFIQKPGQLKNFITNVLGPYDDITRFEYVKNTNKQYGDVLIGVELSDKNDLSKLINNLDTNNFIYQKLDKDDIVYSMLV